MTTFSNTIIDWHHQHGRHDLPWQGTTDPYKIWISEIMLQQTQVATVIPYYKRFLQRFPTVQSLASANIDEVLHLWTGLGYYARGRNLHKAAQQIVNDFDEQFPRNLDDMMSLSGIGRSTAGAILSFAFSLRHPILDGNVKRVLSRVFGVEGWYGKSDIAKNFWLLAEEHTPTQNIATYTQAIMDFGATLCTRSKPTCKLCPLKKSCIAFIENRTSELPSKKPKKIIPVKACQMIVIQNSHNEVFMVQRPPSGIWGGLWSIPEFELDTDINASLAKDFGLNIAELNKGQKFRHTFSHYHLDIQPLFARLNDNTSNAYINNTQNKIHDTATAWIDFNKTIEIGLPAPIKKLLTTIENT